MGRVANSGGHGKSPTDPSHCCSCNNCTSENRDYYNMCECTTCRNLGNSIDICCQCCSCSTEQYARYHVASMAMQEDTLEVCLQNDEIALAHAERSQQSSQHCHDCNHPNQSRSQRPVFHGWQQQMNRRAKQCAKGRKA